MDKFIFTDMYKFILQQNKLLSKNYQDAKNIEVVFYVYYFHNWNKITNIWFAKRIDKYKRTFCTYHQGKQKANTKDLSNHASGVGSTSELNRSLYIHTNSMPKPARI